MAVEDQISIAVYFTPSEIEALAEYVEEGACEDRPALVRAARLVRRALQRDEALIAKARRIKQ